MQCYTEYYRIELSIRYLRKLINSLCAFTCLRFPERKFKDLFIGGQIWDFIVIAKIRLQRNNSQICEYPRVQLFAVVNKQAYITDQSGLVLVCLLLVCPFNSFMLILRNTRINFTSLIPLAYVQSSKSTDWNYSLRDQQRLCVLK